MAEKKTATKKVATTEKATAKKACATKKTAEAPVKKACAKTAAKADVKAELYINAESVGFRAGDVYNALAGAEHTLTVAGIAKAANISTEEVLLGLGWLFKEGKVVGENVADLRLA